MRGERFQRVNASTRAQQQLILGGVLAVLGTIYQLFLFGLVAAVWTKLYYLAWGSEVHLPAATRSLSEVNLLLPVALAFVVCCILAYLLLRRSQTELVLAFVLLLLGETCIVLLIMCLPIYRTTSLVQ